MSQDLFTIALLYFTSFFSLINPLGSMPVFLTMTGNLTKKERARTAVKAVITAFVTLMLFAFGGQMLFKFFGISVDSFRVVGGIIFFMMGYDMLNARLSRLKYDDNDLEKELDDIAITPLGIPMIAGPGAITNAIVLMQDAQDIQHQIVLPIAILVVLIATFLSLVGGGTIMKFMGETGNKIMLKLMGLIMMVIAVEFFFAGLKPIVQDMLNITP